VPESVGLALAGRAGTRLVNRLSVPVSRSTLLRLVRELPAAPNRTVTVVGADDFAIRRGRIYGTVLLDMVTRRPDLDQTATEARVTHGQQGKLAPRIREHYRQVHALPAEGKSIKAIVRELGLARSTVRRLTRATTVEQLLTKAHARRPSVLDPFKSTR
jgi:FixJ family two-component response regulator